MQDGLHPMYMYQDRILSFLNSLLYQGPILLNGLSTDLKCSNYVMDFKRFNKQQMFFMSDIHAIFMSDIEYLYLAWGRKNTLCNWPRRKNMF